MEVARGTEEQNQKYCSKDGDYKEYGSPKKQGARRDIVDAVNEIKDGRKVEDIIINEPGMYAKFGRTLDKAEDIMLRKQYRSWMTTCDWYYGETGVGKSHKAFENFDPETHYVWKDDRGWQDGYTGQETVIINDFRGSIKYNELLQLIDKWPHTLSRRGREPVPFLAKHVIITSSLRPEGIYLHRAEEDSLDQLYRRIKLYQMTSDGTCTEVSRGNTNALDMLCS